MTKSEIYYFAGECLILDEKPEFRKKVLAQQPEDLRKHLLEIYKFNSSINTAIPEQFYEQKQSLAEFL